MLQIKWSTLDDETTKVRAVEELEAKYRKLLPTEKAP